MRKFWERTKKAKVKPKRKVQDPEKMMKQYNRLLLQREMLHRKFVDEAGRLEKRRARKEPSYVR